MKKIIKLPAFLQGFRGLSIAFVLLCIAYIIFSDSKSGQAFYFVGLYILSYHATCLLIKRNVKRNH